jgi:diguanylate cyclase (GGDEF)-like protein/PAS domain S-box-containing protein
VLVHAWNGEIEAHFHFFVMIAVLALYEDWLPFGIAIGYVVLEHGVLGALAPRAVYSHGGNPWAWAAIHGFFVLGATAASVTTWRLNEDMRDRMNRANRTAEETSKRFRHAFESDLSGMALVSPEGRYLQVNRAFCKIVGYTAEELLDRDFKSITHPDDHNIEEQGQLLAGDADTANVEKRYIHRDGSEVWVQLGASAVRDADGTVLYVVAQMQDITARRQFQEELSHRALHDALTGLPNRALFLDRLGHALLRTRRRSSELSVLFLDLDHFKLANDGLGHLAGDAVLVEVARRLSSAARAEDTVARFGGDEFTILCEDAGEDEARRVAERVRAALAAPFVHEGHRFQQTASIGIRVGDGLPPATPELMLRDADLALYTAKERGGARAELFDPLMHTRTLDLLAVEKELQLALSRDELCLHYQPQVDLETGRIVAVEALIRWLHPKRGLIPPDAFIPAAEQSGLIVPMGEWVIRTACSQLTAWRNAGIADGVRMAVNVSARQLSRAELPDTVASALASAELEPAALCLEITESAIIEDPEVALANLDAIKQQGVLIALDDFGVGFSFSHIHSLPPVDTIKIDRSFIAGLGRSDSDGAVITAVLGLARSLGLTAVAEGIETEDQSIRLRGLGCFIGQGFLFSRPRAADQIEALLADGRVQAGVELISAAP